jgi:hypothetical protein
VSLIPHEFIEDGHIYKVPNRYVLGCSDIISLNGLSDHGAIPKATLDRAADRGSRFDEIVQAFEEGNELGSATDEVWACFEGYTNFRAKHKVSVAGDIQKSLVWEHHGTEALIACTPDLPLYIDGELWNVDTKTTYPLSGKARDMKYLAWRIQLQLQVEGFAEDEEFWKYIDGPAAMKKAILHCHPKLKGGFALIPFEGDDSHLADAAVRMAVAKLSAGFQIDRR